MYRLPAGGMAATGRRRGPGRLVAQGRHPVGAAPGERPLLGWKAGRRFQRGAFAARTGCWTRTARAFCSPLPGRRLLFPVALFSTPQRSVAPVRVPPGRRLRGWRRSPSAPAAYFLKAALLAAGVAGAKLPPRFSNGTDPFARCRRRRRPAGGALDHHACLLVAWPRDGDGGCRQGRSRPREAKAAEGRPRASPGGGSVLAARRTNRSCRSRSPRKKPRKRRSRRSPAWFRRRDGGALRRPSPPSEADRRSG